MLADVGDHGPLHPRAGVVPADVRARRVVVPVETVARLGGEVDPADERDAVVDDDRLLVVAMHRPLLRVERALDLRVADEAIAHLPHVLARRAEERQGCARPHQHANVDALRQLTEQVAEHDWLALALERKVGREVPPGQVDVRLGGAQCLRDRRQCLRAVDEDLDRVPGTRRRALVRPSTGRRLQRLEPADPREASSVMAADLLRDLLAEPALHGEERLADRPQRVDASAQILR